MNGNITVASGAAFNFSQNFTAENLDPISPSAARARVAWVP